MCNNILITALIVRLYLKLINQFFKEALYSLNISF